MINMAFLPKPSAVDVRRSVGVCHGGPAAQRLACAGASNFLKHAIGILAVSESGLFVYSIIMPARRLQRASVNSRGGPGGVSDH